MTLNTKKYSLAGLYALWAQLGDIPTGDGGDNPDCIEVPFLDFLAGTPRETIWHWFEAQHPRFIVGDVMQGIRHTEESPSEAAHG